MRFKLILGVVLGFALIIQFIPANQTNPKVTLDVAVPGEAGDILERACYDCHSNETTWPWYGYVAPISWMLAHHVNEGREYLNFSHWDGIAGYDSVETGNEIIEVLETGEMPLAGYLRLHPEARLTESEIETLIAWARTLREP